MSDMIRLYPQYNLTKERRQQKNPVDVDRRSGSDRRTDDRVKLDTALTKDLFEIKSQVAQIQENTQKTIDKTTFTQKVSNAAQNSIKTDQFVKTTNPNLENSPKEAAKSESNEGSMLGMLSAVLGGTVASTFLGVAGIVIAGTVGAYLGAKALSRTILTHLRRR